MMDLGTTAWLALALLSAGPAPADKGENKAEKVMLCGEAVARDTTDLLCFGRESIGMFKKVDLTGVKQLPELKDVTLVDVGGETDLAPLASVPKLEDLDLASEQRLPFPLRKLPVLPHLKRMTIEGWRDFSGLRDQPALEDLWLKFKDGSSLSGLKALTHLKRLLVSAPGEVVTGLDGLPAGLVKLKIPYADLSKARCISGLPQLLSLELSKTAKIGCLGALPKLRVLTVRTSDLSAFATGFPSLWYLSIQYLPKPGAPVDLRPLARLKSLTTLVFSGGNTTDFSSLAALTQLRRLDLSRNEGLSTLAWVAPLTKLYDLDVSSTKVKDITPLAGMPNLEALSLKNSDVRDITGLSGLRKLNTLDLESTKLTDVKPLAGTPNLETLNLKNSQIRDITGLSGLLKLKELDLSSTRVKNIKPLAGTPNLETLNLAETHVRDITALNGLLKLKDLDLSFTRVKNIKPLAGTPNLEKLKLAETRVRDIKALTGLQKLDTVDLSLTRVRSLRPLYDHPALESLLLYYVHVRKAQVARVKRGASKDLWVENEHQ